VDKLLDSKVEGLSSLEKNDPKSSLIENERNDLIKSLKAFGDKDRLPKVLKSKEASLNNEEKFPNPNHDQIQRERLELAKDYLSIGDRDSAKAIAETLMKNLESKEGKPDAARHDIQHRLNLVPICQDWLIHRLWQSSEKAQR